MKLSNRTISTIAEFICGAHGTGGFRWENFPYRTSQDLADFFYHCDFSDVIISGTRKYAVQQVVEDLNSHIASNIHLPSNDIIRIIQELMDPIDFQSNGLDRIAALEDLNNGLVRDGIQAFFDDDGICQIRTTDTKINSVGLQLRHQYWTDKELNRRNEILNFLTQSSEDEFIEILLLPLFRKLGFFRISITGHKDKRLEFGKDLWMKYRLPTNHYIYFGAQVKRSKLDAASKGKNINISEVLNQCRMMLDHPVWDPETNKKHLVDHVYIISAGEITKQAQAWMARKLDQDSRRQIIFMDKNDIIDLAVNCKIQLPKDEKPADDIPF